MKKYIFTALVIGMAALAANAEALTVTHKGAGAFKAELDAAMKEAGIVDYAGVTDLTVISEATVNDDESVGYAYMVNQNFIDIRTHLRPSLQRIDMSQVKFSNDATPGSQWDSNTILNKMTSLTEVILPEGLRALNGGAFTGCTALKTIVLPSTLRVIGSYCFQDCEALELSSLPESLTLVGASAFMNAAKVTVSSLPSNVTRIEADAFNGTNVSFDILPEGLVYLGDKAFRNTKVTFKTLPASLKTLGEHNKSEYIGKAVFVNCTGITEFVIPEVLWKSIPNQTFWIADATEPRSFTCRSLSAPAAAVHATDYLGVFGNAEKFPDITLHILKDAEDAYKAAAPWNTMNITPLTAPIEIAFDSENVTVMHEHYEDALVEGENNVYEGTHQWTVTPAAGKYISRISFEPEVAEEVYAEGDVADDPDVLYIADPDADTSTLSGQPVVVKVPVGPLSLRRLSIQHEAVDNTPSGIDDVETGASFTRNGDIIAVADGEASLYDVSGKIVLKGSSIDLGVLGRGVYILRAGSDTLKIAI